MAKRKADSSELNLDSLMDTVTNVVGVLMIVFIMVSLNIAQSINRVLSDLPPVTQQQHDELLAKVNALPKPENEPDEVNKKIVESEQKIKLTTEQLKTIDLTEVQNQVKFMDLDELRKKIERAKYYRDKDKKELDKLFAELERLKKLLDDTPVFKPPPPQYVRIPNPRPVPQGAVRENFLVAKGRVLYLNDRSFLDIVQKEVAKNRDTLLSPNHPKVTSTTPAAQITYSKDKLLAYFDRARIGDRSIQAKLVPVATAPVMNLNLIPQEGAGETAQDLRNPASFFQRYMRKLKTEPNKIVWLYVVKDSVETYLTAREVADAVGVPVGWQIYAQDFYAMRLPGVTISPFTPPPVNAPVQRVEIAAPKEQLD